MIIHNPLLQKALKLSFLYFICILGIPLLLFSIILFHYFFLPQREIEIFPLDDPHARYRIIYKNHLYALEYEGKESTIANYAYITNSPIDLKPYIDKEVMVTGGFVSSDQQCIVNQCIPQSTNWVGIHIETIR